MTTESGAQSAVPRPARFRVQGIVLVGPMGAGKTTVGRIIGQRLAWTFEDLDDRIQAAADRSIEQIFRESGEAEFRRMEHHALGLALDALQASPGVLALGGGAFVQPENLALIEQSGLPSVFLDGAVDELRRRCLQQQLSRPLLRDEEYFRKLYEMRLPLYMKARLRVDTQGKDVETVAREVLQGLGLPNNIGSQEVKH